MLDISHYSVKTAWRLLYPLYMLINVKTMKNATVHGYVLLKEVEMVAKDIKEVLKGSAHYIFIPLA